MNELYGLIGLAFVASILYWNIKEKYRLYTIVTACVSYLVYLDYLSFILLAFLLIASYILLKNRGKNHLLLYISCLIPVVIFVVFKWSSTYNYGAFNAVMPLGMSYYIFRLIHFTIEVIKKNITDFSFKEFIGYLFFIPVILIGPLIRFPDWQKEIKRNRWDAELISNGLERMLYGLVKVVVLGNYLVTNKLNNYITILSDSELWFKSYLECFSYAANSYLLFSGYSDVAIGSSMLFGIRIMENFRYPFLARSINDFWNRWHISLSSWCRDYVFMPVVSATRIYWIAILTSMLVLGLWHEFSSRYVAWALFHVIGIFIWYMYTNYLADFFKKNLTYELVSWFITINFVIISFAFLKETSLQKSLHTILIILGLK